MNEGAGSSAFYEWNPWKGKFHWSEPYQETTGYLIETLLDFDEIFPDEGLFAKAESCANWLLDVQSDEGYWKSGLGNGEMPSVFNTAQIVFGLRAMYKRTGKPIYQSAIIRASTWLVDGLDESGKWPMFPYSAGHIPTYYSRALWGMLLGFDALNSSQIQTARPGLNWLQSKQSANGQFKDWSLHKNQPATTHTMVYTYRGYLESAQILGDDNAVVFLRSALSKLFDEMRKHGKVAGSYNADWRGDYSFKCVTGHCQLTSLLVRMHELTGLDIYLDHARSIFLEVKESPSKKNNIDRRGGLPGSLPFHGKYQQFRYLNWAAKFYLDAYFKLSNLSYL